MKKLLYAFALLLTLLNHVACTPTAISDGVSNTGQQGDTVIGEESSDDDDEDEDD